MAEALGATLCRGDRGGRRPQRSRAGGARGGLCLCHRRGPAPCCAAPRAAAVPAVLSVHGGPEPPQSAGLRASALLRPLEEGRHSALGAEAPAAHWRSLCRGARMSVPAARAALSQIVSESPWGAADLGVCYQVLAEEVGRGRCRASHQGVHSPRHSVSPRLALGAAENSSRASHRRLLTGLVLLSCLGALPPLPR